MVGVEELTLADVAAVATVGSLLIAATTAFVSAAFVVLSKRRDMMLRAEKVRDMKRFAFAVVRAACAEADQRLFHYGLVRGNFHLRPIIHKGAVKELLRGADVFPEIVQDSLAQTMRLMSVAETSRRELNQAIKRDFPDYRLNLMFEDYQAVLQELVETGRHLCKVLGYDLHVGLWNPKYPRVEHGLFGRASQ